jgi:hypothetical protein
VSRLLIHPINRLPGCFAADAKIVEDDTSQLNRLEYKRCAFCSLTLSWLAECRVLTAHGSRAKARNALSKFYGQAERAISIRKLKSLLILHSEPIKLVVF